MQRCEQCGQINDNYDERCVYCGAYLYISVDQEDNQFNYSDDDDSIDLTSEILDELTQSDSEPLDYNDASDNLFDRVVEDNLYHEDSDNYEFEVDEDEGYFDEDSQKRSTGKEPKKRHIIELEYELKKKIKRNKRLEKSFGIEFKDIDIDLTNLTQPFDILGSYRLSTQRGFRQVRLSAICYDILKNKIERNDIILKASNGSFRNFKISINPNIHKTAMIILLPEEIIEESPKEKKISQKRKSHSLGEIPKKNIYIEQMRDIERKIGMKISNTSVIIKAEDRFEIVGEIYIKTPDKYNSILITATCYDSNNEIIATESTRINTKLYLGFDTLRLKVDEVDVSRVEHVRLYPTLQG